MKVHIAMIAFLVACVGTQTRASDLSKGSSGKQLSSSTTETQARTPAGTDGSKPLNAISSTPSADEYVLDWHSINGGGVVDALSPAYRVGSSLGQTVAGMGVSENFMIGVGFWYGASGAAVTCLITMTGDVNVSESLTSADIIYLVAYVFKGGPAPLPCAAAGDVNCDGVVTSADVIYLVGYVFKGGPPPCDVCTLVPGTWTCP